MSTQYDPAQAIEKDLRQALQHLWASSQELKSQRLQKQTVLDYINDAILIVDSNELIVYTNRRFGVLFRTDKNKWENTQFEDFHRHINSILDEEHVAEFLQIYQEIKNDKPRHTTSIDFPTRDQRAFRMFTGPILNPQTNYLGRIWKFEDVTHEIELQKMKDEFISVASHQLRSPVTAIYGYLQMLDEGTYGDIPDSIKQPITNLRHSAVQMRQLVNDLLDVSRLESGRVKIEIERANLLQILRDVVKDQKDEIEKKDLHINLTSDEQHIELNTDHTLVTEMFKNYLNNAIKYSHHHGNISIDVERKNHFWKISVTDQGMGVPAHQQHQLFDKFFRADNAREQDIEGSGLGLYYIAECADALGGDVGFKSQQGKGSTFWFTLPLGS